MRESRLFMTVAGIALLILLSGPVAFADESTAHLVFKKTASAPQDTINYIVKPGDLLSRIVSQQFGAISPAKEKALYKTIRSLNPKLKDKDKIYPGQVLLLPTRTDEFQEPETPADPSVYKTKKGDTLFGIIYRRLGAKGATALKTLKLVKQLNPGIKNVNMIYPGQMLKLPEGGKLITLEDYDRLAKGKETPDAEMEQPQEKGILPSENRLDVIREVLARMNGSITTTGFYYIPIPDMGQATIDCSMIPVVEFDDGSTVMLDFTKRMNEALKKAIESKWGNIAMVKVESSDDSATILSKAVNASRSYVMTRQAKPFSLGQNLKVALSVDWIISKRKGEDKPYQQAFTVLRDKASVLPRAILNYAERNGFVITDAENDTIVTASAEEKMTSMSTTTLRASNDGGMVDELLSAMGYQTEKDTEIRVFDTANNGFNLAIKADYLLKIPARSVAPTEAGEAKTTSRQTETAGRSDKGWGVILTATARTNIRANRALNAKIKGRLEAGQKIKGDFLENDWYAVFKEDEATRDISLALGYVYAPRLTAAAPLDNNESAPPSLAADAKEPAGAREEKGKTWGQMMEAESRTNIRAKRSISSGLKGRLEAGQKIKADFLEEDWYAVFAVDEATRDESKALGYVYAPRLNPVQSGTISNPKSEIPKREAPLSPSAGRQIIFHSKKLPQQFVNLLKEKGTDVVYINQGDTKRVLIEKILKALNLNQAYSIHSFSIPRNEKAPRVTINMPAFSILTKSGQAFLVDYDVDSDIYGLLNEKWGVNIITF
jgi:LysM repeat protein